MNKNILIGLNTSWSAFNFRSNLIKALIFEGYKVTVVSPVDEYTSRVKDLGCDFIEINLDPVGKNIFQEIYTFLQYLVIFFQVRPDYFLGFTIKPNLYGSIAAVLTNTRVLNNIAGLGRLFKQDTWQVWFFFKLYKIALSRSKKIFFQNKEDKDFFVTKKIVQSQKVSILPGSGVNLEKFAPTAMPARKATIFAFVGRLLLSKGICEFYEAAYQLIQNRCDCEFLVVGIPCQGDPDSIELDALNSLPGSRDVKLLPMSDSVEEILGRVHCLVLPSYYPEGTPRVLLEAAACGRVVVTTDAKGCRDAVIPDQTGFLCEPRNAISLRKSMEKIANLSTEELVRMGSLARSMVEKSYDEKRVIDIYLSSIKAAF